MADWSKLPYDLIHKFASYLTTVEDFLAFSAVCCSWRSVYSAKEWHQGPQIPWLLLSGNENSSSRKFISMHNNKVYSLEIPEARDRRCWGSSLGWLVTIGTDHKIQLLNPLTRVSVTLPSRSFSLHIHYRESGVVDWYDIVEKAFVFKKKPRTSSRAANDEDELLVMVIYGSEKRLAFCRPGYTCWTGVERGVLNDGFLDVACVRDRIFALCETGSLAVVDVDGLPFIRAIGWRRRGDLFFSLSRRGKEQAFLVEASGDLWMVYRNPGHRIESVSFAVLTFDFDNKRWIRLSSLGSRTVFVGDTGSTSVSVPERFNCESNSICFIGNFYKQRWLFGKVRVDVGVYSMADRISKPLRFDTLVPEFDSVPMWLMPTLQ